MTNDTVNKILVIAAVLAITDSLIPKSRYAKKCFVWAYRKVKAIKIDEPPITLKIPPPAPQAVQATSPEEMIKRLSKALSGLSKPGVLAAPADPVVKEPTTRRGHTSPDGVTKVIKRNLMCPGQGALVASETTRIGLAGIRYLVERYIPGEQAPRYKLTPNKDEANAQWFEWYDEIKRSNNGGFGGCSGTGLDGQRPF